ncbi:AAA family ATPase [Flavobacterium sp. ZS1P14]|uniref:AAA family ATPase n=1 Tax=Flavobacterium sp. ZS1P14 TaxID=3401729 RepID=UPI003AAFEFFB
MEENEELLQNQVDENLESEVKRFADSLPYWAKYLGAQILDGHEVTNEIIEAAYTYLLEELELRDKSTRTPIEINYSAVDVSAYKGDLVLKELKNVEGVNALIEGQIIEFSQFLTIIYGANGSGKSSYIRLLKKIFYSKSPEDILPNVHLDHGHKDLKAELVFSSGGVDIPLEFPANQDNAEFRQFSVFDGKSVIKHLEQKNEFEFRPAGLGFFAEYSAAINQLEQRLQIDVSSKSAINQFGLWFNGDSEIKTFVESLSANTKAEDLNKYVPYSDEDKVQRTKLQKVYDELLLASAGKDKEIGNLQTIKRLLGENKQAIELLNVFFSTASLKSISGKIEDVAAKEAVLKAEGVENFKTDKVEGIGTSEWKNLIIAADEFAKKQMENPDDYPELGDNCLLCHQPLSEDAQNLISNCFSFIKSVAEQEARTAADELNNLKDRVEKLSFDLFPDDNILTQWLSDTHQTELAIIKKNLADQKALAALLVSNMAAKKPVLRTELQTSVEVHETLTIKIDKGIKTLEEGTEKTELAKLLASVTFFEHKEKFNTHFATLESFVKALVWIKKAGKANFAKRQITDTEKLLSNKYFNQKYVDTFNEECQKLNGNFGIEIAYTGAAGKSYRQLRLKGRNPNAVLSEGEQKVIAIADFLAEMQMSEINRGIIFDDPVTSLDDYRKSEIACRIVEIAQTKQVSVFTHDLAFVAALISHSNGLGMAHDCHWIENEDGKKPGKIWLKNTPSYEKEYKTSGKAQGYLTAAKSVGPEFREQNLKNGFAALRTSYEAMVVFTLFNGVVQRFEERVSVDSLARIKFDDTVREELVDSFFQCCRYMEGHLHSNRYQYVKPTADNLQAEIQRFDNLNKKVKALRVQQN